MRSPKFASLLLCLPAVLGTAVPREDSGSGRAFEAAAVPLDNGTIVPYGHKKHPVANMPVNFECYSMGDSQNFKWDGEWQFNMSDCREKWEADNTWSEHFCGGMKWYRGTRVWDSPADCATVCRICLEDKIHNQFHHAQCEYKIKLAKCWMGYKPEHVDA